VIRLSPGRLALACVLLTLALSPAAGQGQQQTFHKPMAPIGPTSEDQCRMLEAEWSRVCRQISDAHQQCLDSYNGSDVKGAGECSRGPCLAIHVEMTTCGGAERQQAVSSCYAAVRDHQGREAQFQRIQAEAARAQQEAERAHRDRLAAETARYGAEADAARRRADAYRNSTSSSQRQSPTPDMRHAGVIRNVRDHADTAAAAAAAVGGAVLDTIAETDFSQLTDSVRELLRNEGIDILAAGLGQVEPFDEGFEKLEQIGSFGEVALGIWNGGKYVRSRLLGDLPPGPDWNAMLDSIEFMSSSAANIPVLNLPTLGPVTNVVRGLRNSHEYARRHLQGMVQAYLDGTPYQPDRNFDGNFFRELLNDSIPLERAERLKRAAEDASYTVESSWDNFTNKMNRLFNP
jgi:hypothetical protein